MIVAKGRYDCGDIAGSSFAIHIGESLGARLKLSFVNVGDDFDLGILMGFNQFSPDAAIATISGPSTDDVVMEFAASFPYIFFQISRTANPPAGAGVSFAYAVVA
jgi:hypothetical protein